MLYATVRQRKIHVKKPETVIQNGVNVDWLKLEMDDEWAEMDSIVCVFVNQYTEEVDGKLEKKEIAKQMLHTFGKEVRVPWECLEKTGTLSVSCTGYVDGEKVMTTMYPDSYWNVVQNGPVTGGETMEPTASLYNQVLAAAGEATAAAIAANQAKDQLLQDAANGVFNGKDGQDVHVSVGDTQTGNPGSEAEVYATGTDQDLKLHFVIPRGESGPPGHTPVKGVDYWTDAEQEALDSSTQAANDAANRANEAVNQFRLVVTISDVRNEQGSGGRPGGSDLTPVGYTYAPDFNTILDAVQSGANVCAVYRDVVYYPVAVSFLSLVFGCLGPYDLTNESFIRLSPFSNTASFVERKMVDETLSVSGIAADAKAVGDAIAALQTGGGSGGAGISEIVFKEQSDEGNVYTVRLTDETSCEITAPFGPEGEKGAPFTYEDFTAEQLASLKGEPGYTPVKGVDYFDGKDGKDGSNGKDGQDGQPGQDGYTPVRGTDYWTAADIAEIKSYVDDAILNGAW